MNRRGFLGRLAGIFVAVPVIAQATSAPEPIAPALSFPELNYIDFPENITDIVPMAGNLFVFTQRGIYEMDGVTGRFVSEGGRFHAEHIYPDLVSIRIKQLR